MLAISAATGTVHAQSALPLRLDPATTATGTTLLLAVDGRDLVSGGRMATSLAAALPRGTRFDARARSASCTAAQARTQCPAASRIGSGRMAVAVTGYPSATGETELTWSITAYLRTPLRPGDPAAVVLRSELLAAAGIPALLGPVLAGDLPRSTTSTGRVVRPPSGRYGLEVRLDALPGAISVLAPATAAPARLELALGAVRRVKQPFVRVVRVRTLSGVEVQRIPDHRLVGYDLLRTPERCSGGTWPTELRLGFPSGPARRSAAGLLCSAAD